MHFARDRVNWLFRAVGGKGGRADSCFISRMLNKAVKRPHPPELTFPACISKLGSEVRFEKADGVGKGRLMCFITVS